MARTVLIVILLLGCHALAADELNMVLIPQGEYVMGSGLRDDEARHIVFVSPFVMAEREITVGEFREFTLSAGVPFPWSSSEFTQQSKYLDGDDVDDQTAMFSVTWYEAVWYANWRSGIEGLERVYEFDEGSVRRYLYDYHVGLEAPDVKWQRGADGYRLPTEAEWEFAATERGILDQLGEEGLIARAWFRDTADGRVHPVKKKEPSRLGLYDMLGNVSEWCWDYYGRDYYAESPSVDPAGPIEADEIYRFPDRTDIRVVRGCSWKDVSSFCAPRERMATLAAIRSTVGIRLVRNAE